MHFVAKLTGGLLLAAAVLFDPALALAQRSKSGGGGTTAAYTIVDLQNPYHAADGNWSQAYAAKISAPHPQTGVAFISGTYVRLGQSSLCLWSVSGTQVVGVTDLTGVIDPTDVNAAGVVGGMVNDRPTVLIPGIGVVSLPTTSNGFGQVTALNDR